MYNHLKSVTETILDKTVLKNRHFVDWMKWRLISNGMLDTYVVLSGDKGLYYRNGIFFKISPMLAHTTTAFEDYDFSDFDINENFLDIGACTGGACLQIGKRIKEGGGSGHVFAIEPLYADELRENIKINDLEKYITVFELALGVNCIDKLEYGGSMNSYFIQKDVRFVGFKDILDLCKVPVHYIKSDCEGGEHFITPEDLKKSKRFVGEIHVNKYFTIDHFLDVLNASGFNYTIHNRVVNATKQ